MATPESGTRSGLTRRQRYEQLRASLLLERSSFDTEWQELATYLAPKRTRFQTSDRNRGGRKPVEIIDSSPRTAARTLASGLHAGITSPARPWFRLTTPDAALAELGPVKEWLHTVTERMHTVFLRSNIYNALPILYGDLGVFATAAMSMLEDDEDMLRSYSYPLGSYVFGLDARGVASTFVYDYRRTVRQLVEQFGPSESNPRVTDWSKFSLHIKTCWEQGQTETPIDVCWVVMPNDRYDPEALEAAYSMKFSSCHFERGVQNEQFAGDRVGFLRESGFRRFPILIPRWDVTGDDSFGTDCPAMVAIGDVKQLQFQQRKKAKAIDKSIDPPLKAPMSLRNQKVSLLPGDITYVAEQERNGGGLAPIHETRLEGLRELVLDMAEARERIRQAFFADLFLMLASSDQVQPITAEEVRARQEEKLIALGPVLERLNDELLDPLIDRTFDIMLAAGAIPEPPDALEGVELKVEYISVMAAAQKLVGIAGHDRLLNTVLAMAEAFPDVRHKFNAMQFVDDLADKLGVGPKVVRTDEEAEARVAAEQQQIQQQQQAEQMKTLAQGTQALGNTPLGGDTALAEMRRQAQQPQNPQGVAA